MQGRIVGPSDPTLAAPPWAGDMLSQENLVRGPLQLIGTAFPTRDRVKVIVGAAGASATDTTIPIDALLGDIPNGTVLNFGTNKFATLSVAAVATDTDLTVLAIPTDVVDNDAAYYEPYTDRPIASGTCIGRTLAEAAAGTAFGPGHVDDDQLYLLAFPIDNADAALIDFEAYRPGNWLQVKEDLLPEWGDTDFWGTTLVTALRLLYNFTLSGG